MKSKRFKESCGDYNEVDFNRYFPININYMEKFSSTDEDVTTFNILEIASLKFQEYMLLDFKEEDVIYNNRIRQLFENIINICKEGDWKN